jgi:hypothetical protein
MSNTKESLIVLHESGNGLGMMVTGSIFCFFNPLLGLPIYGYGSKKVYTNYEKYKRLDLGKNSTQEGKNEFNMGFLNGVANSLFGWCFIQKSIPCN